MKSFPKGGIHPSDNKLTRSLPIERLALPEVVYVPLSQHLGEPAVAVVERGDSVKTGQLIAKAVGFVSANVHAPISGTVESVDIRLNAQGKPQEMITIKSDGEDTWAEGVDHSSEIVRECTLTREEILQKIVDAGVVGMGGAGFPTHVKLTIPTGKRAEYLLINGAECEPYLTCDHRVMLERGEELLMGVKILMQALGLSEARIGVENNKHDAIEHLREWVRERAEYKGIRVVALKVKYPQGGEKQLVAALTGRRTPPPPGLPIDVGCVVCNISTAVAIYEAVQKNKPLIERTLTVSGRGMDRPKNLQVRIGTPIASFIETPQGQVKVLNGGPMMGKPMSYMDAPVLKTMSGITFLEGPASRRRPQRECIKCARCVGVCPMGLEPYLLMKLSRAEMWERLEREWMIACIECGCCQFTCPAGIPLLDFIRLGKQEVRKRHKI